MRVTRLNELLQQRTVHVDAVQAAYFLGVPPHKVARWLDEGRLPRPTSAEGNRYMAHLSLVEGNRLRDMLADGMLDRFDRWRRGELEIEFPSHREGRAETSSRSRRS